jgi:hypothetical protein
MTGRKHSTNPMRPVHYHASGHGGLRFDCYLWERDFGYLASGGRSKDVPPLPRPRRHTDLRKVTCSECWRAIRTMADKRVGTIDAVARQHLPTRDAR